jgi:beta-phosphoglucomutase-like phosphatase (HAD superfamily)
LNDTVVFDMEGLLTESEPLWRLAEVEIVSTVGVPIDDDAARSTTARPPASASATSGGTTSSKGCCTWPAP